MGLIKIKKKYFLDMKNLKWGTFVQEVLDD